MTIATVFLFHWIVLPPMLAAATILARHLAPHAALPPQNWGARPVMAAPAIAAG